MKTNGALPTLILTLVVACRQGGSGPTTPVEPTLRLIPSVPCLTQPPADPGPVLRGIPECEADDEGGCPALTSEQDAALWVRVEVLEAYADHAWRSCGDLGGRGVPSGSGASANAADP